MYGCIICEHPKRYLTLNYDIFLVIEKEKKTTSPLPFKNLNGNPYNKINCLFVYVVHTYLF